MMTADQKAIVVGTLNYLIQRHTAEISGIFSRIKSQVYAITIPDASIMPTSVERKAGDDAGGFFPIGLSSSQLAFLQEGIESMGHHRLIVAEMVQMKLALFNDPDTPGGEIIASQILEFAKAVPAAAVQPVDVS